MPLVTTPINIDVGIPLTSATAASAGWVVLDVVDMCAGIEVE